MHSLFIQSAPSNPDSLWPSAPYFGVNRRMEDPTNMRNSTRNTGEKHSFEDSVLAPAWFTSAVNVNRNFSGKLLAWAVEERGSTYPVVIFELGQA